MKQLNFIHHFKIFLLVLSMNWKSLLGRKVQWFSLLLFAITLLFLFPFAFGTDMLRQFEVQIGCYWMIQEFVAVLIILNMFKIEQEGNLFDVYKATRYSPLAFFWGKVCFTTLYFCSLQVPLLFLWGIIFNLDSNTIFLLYPKLVLINLIFAFSSSLLGAFLHAITHKNSLKEILQSLLFFPLQGALLLANVGICLHIYNNQVTASASAWWNVIVINPLLFVGLSLLFGDILYEE